jgi:hypothetical protein
MLPALGPKRAALEAATSLLFVLFFCRAFASTAQTSFVDHDEVSCRGEKVAAHQRPAATVNPAL